jgi:hypothetical protein
MTVEQLSPCLVHFKEHDKDRVVNQVQVRDGKPCTCLPGEWQALDAQVEGESAIIETMLGVGYFQAGTVWVCMEKEL